MELDNQNSEKTVPEIVKTEVKEEPETESTIEKSEEEPKTELTAEKPNEFTSEIFKIEVKNLPKSVGFGGIKKFLLNLKLKLVKIKSPGNCTFCFVTFANEEDRQEALKIVNEAVFKGKKLSACYAKATEDPMKRKNQENSESSKAARNNSNKNDVHEVKKSPEERVQNATTPLWNIPYEKQVEQKRSHIKQILRKTFFKMEKINKDTYFWLQKQSKDTGGCCELNEFVESPIIDNYRNKCEFTIGFDSTETKAVIGQRLGEYKTGSNEVVEPTVCRHITEHMKQFTKKMQEYIDQSTYDPINVRTKTGHWRQLTLRSNEEKDLLAIFVFDKKDLTDEEIQNEKEKLSEFLKKNFENNPENEHLKLKSLLFNLNTNRSGISRMDNLDLIFGVNYLNESLLGLNFQISPLAFFQSNTKGAELLYSKIGEICDLDQDTVLLDICCGTGTIGLTLSKKAKLVVGVEIIPEAIEDAKLNSKLNNITNVEFHCGKAEEVLPNILKRFTNEKVVAIVDPPRAGLHNKVIQNLRHLKNLKSLIYVSCNPELAMQNFIDLSRDTSKQYGNQPFVPIKAIAVDMFPHTTHCELILYFTRYSNELIKGPAIKKEETA